MGRELRFVPPHWEHPKTADGKYQPMHDQSYEDAQRQYNAEMDGDPPDPNYYRPNWAAGEATWFQVYENVTEGTPMTPPFASRDELAAHLVAHGDDWVRNGEPNPWTSEAAFRFVFELGYAPTFVYTPATGLISGVAALA